MTNSIFDDLDIELHDAFLDAGMADMASLHTDGRAIPCRIYVDFEAAVAQIAGVTLTRMQGVVRVVREAGVPAPRVGDSIVTGATTFFVDKGIQSTESMWWLICHR